VGVTRDRQARTAWLTKYQVQDRLWHERDLARNLFFQHDARAYICGSSKVGKGVADVVARMTVESGRCKTEDEGRKWWEGMRGERWAVDVFD
jgi:cytochrome P450 / NADPH-cytochrome P450 reductase